MADNISMRDNSSGYNADLAHLLSSFASNNGELRDILRTLNDTLKKVQSDSGKSKDSSWDREMKSRIKGITSLEKFTDSITEVDKILTQVSRDLEKSSTKIQKSDIGSSLADVQTKLAKEHDKIYTDAAESLNNVPKLYRKLISLHEIHARNVIRLEAAINKNDDKEFDAILRRQTKLESLIKAKKQELDSEIKVSNSVNKKLERLAELTKREANSIADSLKARTELGSEASKYKPEGAKKWEDFTGGLRDYFQPKKSQQYLESKAKFEDRKDYLDKQKFETDFNIGRYTRNNEDISKSLVKNEQLIQQLSESGEEEKVEELKEQQKALQEKFEINQQELEILQRQSELIDAEYEYLNDAEKSMNSNASTGMNILNSALKFVQKTVTKAVDRELSNLNTAATELFNSFESLQDSLGKQLKLSSGAYDDMKDMLMAAADEAGKAIDVTQLNAAAASISEMGITNQDLITQMAVGVAKFSEAGVSVQLDEETAKQMNTTFQELKRSGKSDEEAARIVAQRFDDMIAIEESIRQQYDSTMALENGGWQEIQNLTNRFKATGDITTAEQERDFMASMADAYAAITDIGMDPSVIFSDLESMMSGTMSEIPAYLLAWMGDNALGVQDQDDLFSAMGSGAVGDIAMSIMDKLAEDITGKTTDDAYLKNIYGTSFTPEQLRALAARNEQAQESYRSTDFSAEALQDFGESVQKGLEKGSYLSETKKLEKTNLSLMQELASTYQNIPDGAFWMGEGFNAIQGIVDGAMNHLFEFLTALIAGKNLFGGGSGGLFGGSGDGGGSGDWGTTLKDFAFGNKETTAGKIGSYGTMAVGGVMSVGSAISNFKDADNFEDGLISTFRDPTFTSGLGTTIGGAIAGPIGGAVGGAIGSFIPAASEGLENFLIGAGTTFGLISDAAEKEEERRQKEAEAIEKAAQDLSMAAEKHSNTAKTQESELERQQQIFESYDANQKENFLIQQGKTAEEIQNLKSRGEIDDAFAIAVADWVEGQQKLINQEKLLSEGADLISESFGKAFGINNAADWDASEFKKDELAAHAKARGIEGYENMSKKELAEALTSYDEDIANKQLSRNEAGMASIEAAKQFAIESGASYVKTTTDDEGNEVVEITDMRKAYADYLRSLDANFSDEQIENMSIEAESSDEDRKKYDAANEKFHEKINDILEKDPSIKDYTTLFTRYKEAYDNFEPSAVQDLETSVNGYEIGGDVTFEPGDLPDLKYHNKAQTATSYDYKPSYYDGKFKTGLDYVPLDDYIALLHQGEMVLNKTQADEYRKSSSGLLNSLLNMGDVVENAIHTTILNNKDSSSATMLDTTPLINSVNTQTDRIEALLTKILQVLTSRNSSVSKLPKSILQMNSDISLL